MTHIVTGRTLTGEHAMIAVESFRAHLFAAVSHPAGLANARPIVLATVGIIVTVAALTAVRTEVHVLARFRTVRSHPARCALTFAGDVITLATVLAIAHFRTILTVVAGRAGMFACRPNIAR